MGGKGTYLYHSLKHMSQGQEGNMDITGHHWTAMLKHVHRDTQTHEIHNQTNIRKHRHRQGGKAVSVNVCTSTTLSNMWAKGRKDSMTSSEVVGAQDWREGENLNKGPLLFLLKCGLKCQYNRLDTDKKLMIRPLFPFYTVKLDSYYSNLPPYLVLLLSYMLCFHCISLCSWLPL